MSTDPRNHEVPTNLLAPSQPRKSSRRHYKPKASKLPEDLGRRSLPQTAQPDSSLTCLLLSTCPNEVQREAEEAPIPLLSPRLETAKSPLKKPKKKRSRRSAAEREEVKKNREEISLGTDSSSQLDLYEGLETSATDYTAGIPQVGSNLPTLSDSDEEDCPPSALFPKDSRLSYDPSFILSLRNDPQSLLITEDLAMLSRRGIRCTRGENWPSDSQKSPVLKPMEVPAEVELWRREETEEEKKIGQEAKAQTDRLKSEKSDLELKQRTLKATLNKLSPDNFEKLKDQLLGLSQENDQTMALMTRLIFDKAILQAKYTKVYAELCHYLDNYYASLCPSISEGRKNVRKYVEIQRSTAGFMPRSLR